MLRTSTLYQPGVSFVQFCGEQELHNNLQGSYEIEEIFQNLTKWKKSVESHVLGKGQAFTLEKGRALCTSLFFGASHLGY
jgi:hypothetical protein